MKTEMLLLAGFSATWDKKPLINYRQTGPSGGHLYGVLNVLKGGKQMEFRTINSQP